MPKRKIQQVFQEKNELKKKLDKNWHKFLSEKLRLEKLKPSMARINIRII